MPENSVMENFGEWAHLRHPAQHANAQDHPQESRMPSKFADAKDALDRVGAMLAAVPQNQLAEAIVEAGVGQSFTPKDVQLALAMIRAIDQYGPGTNQVLTYGDPQQQAQKQTMTPPVSFSAAPVPATQVQPQQTV